MRSSIYNAWVRQMDELEDRQKCYSFLLQCMGDLINCCEDFDLLSEEIDWALCQWAHVACDDTNQDMLWLEATMKAKEESRGKARQNLAAVLAWRLSHAGEKDDSKRAQLLADPRPHWLQPETLIGARLTEIEACRLKRRTRCRCETSCQGIKFRREWDKIEEARRRLVAAGKNEPGG